MDYIVRVAHKQKKEQKIAVFFHAITDLPSGGLVVLDTPEGFDVGANCVVSDLPDSYYGVRGDATTWSGYLRRLPNKRGCSGTVWPESRRTEMRMSGGCSASSSSSSIAKLA